MIKHLLVFSLPISSVFQRVTQACHDANNMLQTLLGTLTAQCVELYSSLEVFQNINDIFRTEAVFASVRQTVENFHYPKSSFIN